ncbi:MAG: UDP-N-acetylmuramoyl-L-alanine--D-glutamate ligase [Pseudomonadota bacterium]
MILIPGARKKSFGVFGLGVSGIAACEALAASGAKVFSWDEKPEVRKRTEGTEFLAEHPKAWPWKELDAVVVSPGVPLTFPKPHAIVRKSQQEKVPVIGDTELFARAVNDLPKEARPRVVAVTGSNGKSTTAALIGHVLNDVGEIAYVGGNIGEAVLSLPAFRPEAIYVLELSSFQLDLTASLRANAAVFLNFSPDHLDRHGSLEAYLDAKKRIFLNQQSDDIAIVGVDDSYAQSTCTELTAKACANVAPVSANSTLGRGVYALEGELFHNMDGKTSRAGALSNAQSLRGEHNHQNAAAALAACLHLGVSPALFIRAAERFSSLPHRMEEVARVGKVVFINDSKATNAAAAARALSAYSDIFWIAGGKAKEEGASPLRALMKPVHAAYLIGEDAPLFEEQLGAAVDCVQCHDLQTAVMRAGADAAASDAANPVVLLSPACASYDQFKNFEARGAAFSGLAKTLSVENGAAA